MRAEPCVGSASRRLAGLALAVGLAVGVSCGPPSGGGAQPAAGAPQPASGSSGAAPVANAAAAAPAPASVASAPAAPPPMRRVSVAYPATTVTMTGFYIAVQEGYTRDEGVDAEMVMMNGTASAQSMVAKQVDFGMSAGALLTASMRGAPLRNVFVQIDKPLYYLFVQPDVTRIADLAGKPVGIEAIGDSLHLAAQTALRADGADPATVAFIANTANQRAVEALATHAVSGVVVSPPYDVISTRMGFRSLGFLGDYLDYLTSGLATHADIIRERPDLVQSMVRAELKAHRYMQQNREGTIAHMARFQEMAPEDAALAYDSNMKYLTRDGTSSREVLERILQLQRQVLLDQGGTVSDVTVDEAFQLDFARRANAELDQEGWRPR
jgi:NitT/TauT family transport system substrate-binding protein